MLRLRYNWPQGGTAEYPNELAALHLILQAEDQIIAFGTTLQGRDGSTRPYAIIAHEVRFGSLRSGWPAALPAIVRYAPIATNLRIAAK